MIMEKLTLINVVKISEQFSFIFSFQTKIQFPIFFSEIHFPEKFFFPTKHQPLENCWICKNTTILIINILATQYMSCNMLI